MSQIQPQRRARRIAMSDDERDAHLASLRVCRVGTVGAQGAPHVSALWYAWDGSALWLYSIIKSQRWVNLVRDPRVSVVIDTGVDYFELRGVEFMGEVEFVGEQPRAGEPNPDLEAPERLFAERYWGGAWLGYDLRHAWVRLHPSKQVTWDFRKLGGTETAFNPNR
ncbi:MAG TPA: pyridoxamine 5'-phosphate oxidase family protein [Candidatus Dormibacteraeota bacterium]|nr:pyridoxamine 5'-phosphate oxidase family protein [Candidatus Dormibacteraeota bacterium]